MKYFRMSYEEVVFKRSYINIMLLNRAIPSFKTDKEKDIISSKKRKNKRIEKPIDKATHASDFFSQYM